MANRRGLMQAQYSNKLTRGVLSARSRVLQLQEFVEEILRKFNQEPGRAKGTCGAHEKSHAPCGGVAWIAA
jgi:hypothetical protein